MADMDVLELNEAFAAQVLGCLRELALDAEDPRVNPNGGAIALGHPLGMSGARLLLTAAHELRETGGRYALCDDVRRGGAGDGDDSGAMRSTVRMRLRAAARRSSESATTRSPQSAAPMIYAFEDFIPVVHETRSCTRRPR